MAESKVQNYTETEAANLVAAYVAAGIASGSLADATRKAVVVAQSVELGKTTRSVVAKLVREGVYIKPTRISKTGNKPETKAAMVTRLAALMDMEESCLAGMEAATKGALENVIIFILGVQEELDERPEMEESDTA